MYAAQSICSHRQRKRFDCSNGSHVKRRFNVDTKTFPCRIFVPERKDVTIIMTITFPTLNVRLPNSCSSLYASTVRFSDVSDFQSLSIPTIPYTFILRVISFNFASIPPLQLFLRFLGLLLLLWVTVLVCFGI